MYKQVEKPKENKGKARAYSVAQRQSSSESTFQFFDNRSGAVGQRKPQEAVANSSTVIQLIKNGTSTIQRAEVIQRRTTLVIQVDLDNLKLAVDGMANIPINSTAANIIARQVAIAGHKVTLAALLLEVTQKSDEHGRDVGTEAGINARLAAIPAELADLDARINNGQSAEPPTPTSAWGQGDIRIRHEKWKRDKVALAANTAKRQETQAEQIRITSDIPIAKLIDAKNAITAKINELEANLLIAQKERYWIDVITTIAPVCTHFEDEGNYIEGPSTLGIFKYQMPAILNGINCCVEPIEIHGHYQSGTKKVRKAHVRSDYHYDYSFYQGEAISPARMHNGFDKTVMVQCNGAIP